MAKILNKNDFNLGEQTKTGGVTGSFQVASKNDPNQKYQLKPSILDARWSRKIKAGYRERENFGEVIASCVAKAFVGEDVPEVSLVYDPNSHVRIASKYLPNVLGTLDSYLDEQFNLQLKQNKLRHACIVSSQISNHKLKPGQVKYDNIPPNLKKTLARAIAVSILTGDHDVNPGNMIVYQKKTQAGMQETIARIDFGHAFNDLLNAPEMFGGKLHNKNHPTLDFFNREKIAGIPNGDPPKLWRDYPGLIPSHELADAMLELSTDAAAKVENGVNEAKIHFSALLKQQQSAGDVNQVRHLLKSLSTIYANFNQTVEIKLPKNIKSYEQCHAMVENIFQGILKTCTQYTTDMERTAHIMKLQANIDEYITHQKTTSKNRMNETQLEQKRQEIKQQYQILSPKSFGIEWIKTGIHEQPFKGRIDGYITRRTKQIRSLQELILSKVADYEKNIKKQMFHKKRTGLKKLNLIKAGITKIEQHINTGDIKQAIEAINYLHIDFIAKFQNPSSPDSIKKSKGYQLIQDCRALIEDHEVKNSQEDSTSSQLK